LRPSSVEFVPAAKIDLEDNEVARALCGERNVNLRLIERRLGVKIGQRGTELHLSGPPDALGLAAKLVEQLAEAIKAGHSLFAADVERAIGAVARGELKFKEMVLSPLLIRSGNRQITPKSIAQKRYTEAIRADDIVFAIGPAGTGKTYLAMAMAVSFLQDRKVKRIVLTRPAVEAGEKLGFLPGDLAQKVDPYLRPLYDALNDLMQPEKSLQLLEQNLIEVAPLAFMRGRTLNDAFVILDEAQNTTVEQMKMFLTRLGFNSKAVVTGDVTQIDLPPGRVSGLVHASKILRGIEGIAFADFTEVDVVRHPLVQEVIRAYERDGSRAEPPVESRGSRPEDSTGLQPPDGVDPREA